MAEHKTKTRPATTLKTGKRTYRAETTLVSLSTGLALPPLRMVLVHAQNDRANAAAETVSKSKSKKVLTRQEAVMKIIEHLTKVQ